MDGGGQRGDTAGKPTGEQGSCCSTVGATTTLRDPYSIIQQMCTGMSIDINN